MRRVLRRGGDTIPHRVPILLAVSAACSLFGRRAALADIVICIDGTRYEGRVEEQLGQVIIRTEDGNVKSIDRDKVREILRTSTSAIDRFKIKPTARDLMFLCSRAGMSMDRERAEKIVESLRSAPDTRAAVERILSDLKLTPEAMEAIRKVGVEEWKKLFGPKGFILESRRYLVLTNVDRAVTMKVARHMEAIFHEYQNRLVSKEKLTDKFIVKVFAFREEYRRLGGALPHSSAHFSPFKRELVGCYAVGEEKLWCALYHEGMHQFLHFYVPNPPIWFDEGIAQYFETARPLRYRGGSSRSLRFRVGLKKQGAVRVMRGASRENSLFPLKELISMSRREFYNQARVQLNYSEAWAFTHFLIESRSRQLKQLWIDYFFALREGLGQEEANSRVFGRVNMDRLEALFRAYAKKL